MSKLLDQLPAYYRDIREFRELSSAVTGGYDELDAALESAENDQFIVSSSEQAIARREKYFDIVPDLTLETLVFRKRRLLARMQENAPYTLGYLRELLDSLLNSTSTDLVLDVLLHELEVLIHAENASYYWEVEQLLERMVPLNIVLEVVLRLAIENISISSKQYTFPVVYPICHTFHTADVRGGLTIINTFMNTVGYAFDANYPICGTFVTASIVSKNEQINVVLAAEYRANDILYKRAGTIYAGEGDI